jgi:eukaryotic-like serine/threonine-protein kinase
MTESRWVWPFELLEKIGEGGMGTVYRARYAGNDRLVAVKLLPAEVAAEPTLLARFERELAVLKQLKHPNIVRCFGGTCETEQRFYAMELVEGGTLADLLNRKGRLSWEFVIDYAIQMCAALQYAHEHGVIHRDIKPGNFLLTKSGQIKLSDFGLASIATTNRLTAAGRTVGTIQYMAPEQIRGKPPVTGQTDLYALGCVLYELLTGHPPFQGENAAIVLEQHLKGAIPHVADEVLDCPLKLDALIFELMSKSPDQRPATAAEVEWRLEEILLPGRRSHPAEPDLFASTAKQTVVKTPLQNIARTPSDAALTVPVQSNLGRTMPWIAVALVTLISVGLWIGWNRTDSQLQRAEKTWVELLLSSDPATQDLAVRSLGEFGPLHASTLKTLHAATQDDNPSVRVAVLIVLEKHAAECSSLQTELLRHEKVDEDERVRHQAALTISAMKAVHVPSSTRRILFWVVVLAITIGMVAGGLSVWQRAKPFASKP